MSNWVWSGSLFCFSDEFVSTHLKSPEIVAAFDRNLNYLFVNERACAQLKRVSHDLLGKSIIDLYPHIIASRNHRNLLRALEGETIRDVIDGKPGEFFESVYKPEIRKKEVQCIVVKAKPVLL